MSGEEKYLYFPKFSPAGLSNQRMELEIKVGLAHLSRRTLVTPDRVALKPQYGSIENPDDDNAKLLDLFDVPAKQITASELQEKQHLSISQLPWEGDCSSKAFFCYPGADAFSHTTTTNFEHRRSFCWEFPADDSSQIWVSPQRTLSHYSYFFLAAPEVLRPLHEEILKIRPQSVYCSLADHIVEQLGSFNAVHIRRGDFRDWWVGCPSAENILSNIETVIPRDEPLLICTDSPDDMDFLRPILDRYPKSIFIDQLIEQEYRQKLDQLPFSDSSVIGLLTQLVAIRSDIFVGTIFSTFTSYIQRSRCIIGTDNKMLFVSSPFDSKETPMVNCEFIPVREGEFSWNSYDYSLHPYFFSWFREWPECFQIPEP